MCAILTSIPSNEKKEGRKEKREEGRKDSRQQIQIVVVLPDFLGLVHIPLAGHPPVTEGSPRMQDIQC